MKTLIIAVIVAFIVPLARADAARKAAVIREVIALTDLKGTLEKARLDNVAQTRNALVQQGGDTANNPVMTRLIDRAMEKYTAYSKELFDYSQREKEYVSFYEEAFSETELEGLAAFYKTDVGRALIRSQAILLSRTQQAAFQKSAEQAARVDLIMKETIGEVQAELKKEGKLR